MTREEKARWLADMYAAVAEGKTLQCRIAGCWRDATDDAAPHIGSRKSIWRIKLEPRECIRVVSYLDDCEICGHWVKVPDNWPEGTKVRVTEILE